MRPKQAGCPFCGAGGYLIDLDRDGVYGRCKNLNCDATGPVRRTREDAIAAWNRRSPTPESETTPTERSE